MIIATKASALSLNAVAVVMFLLAAIALPFALPYGFNIPVEWFPFSFATYLKAVGYVFVLATIAEIFLKRGQWGQWGFALFFAAAAFGILSSEKLLTEFPTSSGGLAKVSTCATLLCLGAAHLAYRPKEKTT